MPSPDRYVVGSRVECDVKDKLCRKVAVWLLRNYEARLLLHIFGKNIKNFRLELFAKGRGNPCKDLEIDFAFAGILSSCYLRRFAPLKGHPSLENEALKPFPLPPVLIELHYVYG